MAESTKKIPRSEETAGETPALNQATERLNRAFAVTEISGDVDPFLQANEAIMDGMTALSSEMMDFSKRRLGEVTKRSESLKGCKDADQALRIQYEFAHTTTQQYLEQTNNLLAILAKMTQNFFNPLQEHTQQALRDLTKETGSSKHT